MLKIGLIGLGDMGVKHLREWKRISAEEAVQVVAVADTSPTLIGQAKGVWPEAGIYSSGFDLIAHASVDAVDICLPSFLHMEHAVQAMRKGLAVFSEKPVCLKEEECKELLDVQERTGTPFMVGHVVRFFPEYRFLKERYDDKRYGRLIRITMDRHGKKMVSPWFSDPAKCGSVLHDLQIHDIDFLRYMLGEPEIRYVETNKETSGLVSQAIAVMDFSGIKAISQGQWDVSPSFPFSSQYLASFENATVVCQNTQDPRVKVYCRDGQVEEPAIAYEEDGYYLELKYFVEALLRKETIHIASLSDAVATIRLVNRILERS
jgi:predicted dehydrogenase